MTTTTAATPTTEPNWESDLAQLLKDLTDVQTDLLQVLEQKRSHMAEQNLDGIKSLQEREQQLCDRLQDCHHRRAALLAAAEKFGKPGDSIGSLAKVLPSDRRGQMEEQVKDASHRTRILQHHSLTNWVLAQRSLLHVSQMLEIVATGGRLKPTYGNGDSMNARGALMDREA